MYLGMRAVDLTIFTCSKPCKPAYYKVAFRGPGDTVSPRLSRLHCGNVLSLFPLADCLHARGSISDADHLTTLKGCLPPTCAVSAVNSSAGLLEGRNPLVFRVEVHSSPGWRYEILSTSVIL